MNTIAQLASESVQFADVAVMDVPLQAYLPCDPDILLLASREGAM